MNKGFSRQSWCPNASWHLVLLQLGLLRAVQAVQSCLWLCSRLRFSFLAIWPVRWWQRARSGFSAASFWMRAGSQILQFWRRPFMRATVHLSLLSAATSASLYLTELSQSQSLLLWHQARRPLSLWRDFPPDITWLCHFSAEYGLWTSMNWSSRSSWFPPVCINGTNTWRIMNGFCDEQDSPQFYSKSTGGAINLCHPGGTVRKPWVTPSDSNWQQLFLLPLTGNVQEKS